MISPGPWKWEDNWLVSVDGNDVLYSYDFGGVNPNYADLDAIEAVPELLQALKRAVEIIDNHAHIWRMSGATHVDVTAIKELIKRVDSS